MAVKLTKRKGFNFFRSYFDVYNELGDADKIAFMDALLCRQFLGVKPENLKGMAKFAYISQTNSIDSQVKGYEDKLKVRLDGSEYIKDGESKSKTPLKDVLNTPTDGGTDTPTEQEKEKGEVKEKEKVEDEVKDFDFDAFYDLDVLANYYLSKDQIVNAVISLPANKIKDKEHLENRMKDFKQSLIEQGRVKETFKEFAKYFRNWVKSVEDYNKKPNEVPNPNNEKIITFTSNANPSRQQLPESEFLSFKERMQGGGYIFKIIE